MNYEIKYEKYKKKYLDKKNIIGGVKHTKKKFTHKITNVDELKVMSFNILADAPIWKKKYMDMEKENFIYWNFRKKLIIDIISEHQPDICLLCEVEYDKILFFSQFCNVNNYGYIYTSSDPPKSKESLKNYMNYTSEKNPGILIIFKINKLKLVNNLAPDYINYFYNQQKEHNWTEEALKLRLQQCASNIILFEKLDDTTNRFYFTGLHHPFVKDHEEIQDEQIIFLLKKINKLNTNYNFPVIIAGDFNAKPTYRVYNIMNKEGYSSAYKIANGVENKYTTSNSFTSQKMTLDYIFVNEKCKVKSVEQIDFDYLENNNIPNENYPSDHMFLIANIEI